MDSGDDGYMGAQDGTNNAQGKHRYLCYSTLTLVSEVVPLSSLHPPLMQGRQFKTQEREFFFFDFFSVLVVYCQFSMIHTPPGSADKLLNMVIEEIFTGNVISPVVCTCSLG